MAHGNVSNVNGRNPVSVTIDNTLVCRTKLACLSGEASSRFATPNYKTEKSMKPTRRSACGCWSLFALFFALGGILPASAQEALPRPQPPFKGHVGLTPKDSTLDFP